MVSSIRKQTHGTSLTEATIWLLLNQEGLDPYTWRGSAHRIYPRRAANYYRTLWVTKGMLSLNLTDEARLITLQSGDRIDLPPKTSHEVIVGDKGVVCTEARRYF